MGLIKLLHSLAKQERGKLLSADVVCARVRVCVHLSVECENREPMDCPH